jgi:hypothetical protein
MEWRETDTIIVSKCIEFIEKEIGDGKLEASCFLPVPERKESQALLMYKAWRVHLVDRMMENTIRIDLKVTSLILTKSCKPTSCISKKCRRKSGQQELTMMTTRSNCDKKILI